MSKLKVPIPLARDLTISNEAKILYAEIMAGKSFKGKQEELNRATPLLNELCKSGWAVFTPRWLPENWNPQIYYELFCSIKEE